MPTLRAKSKRFLLLASGLLAIGLMVGGSLEQAAADPRPADAVSICIGGAPGIPILLANEQGLFAAAGLNVTLKKYRTGTEGFAGFLNDDCELASVSETAIVLNSFERHDYSVLASVATSSNSPRILASRKSGISAPQDLKGKRIFVFKGSANHFFLDMFLAKNGWTNKEVTVLLTNVPDLPAAFAEGSIDAFCATEVLIDQARKALGSEAVIFDAPGLSLVSFLLAAKNSVISSRPGMIKKVLAALLVNEQGIKKDPSAVVRTAATALGIEERVMTRVWADYHWKVELSQAMLLSFEQEAQWAIASGLTDKTHIPNYLNYVHRETLEALKPAAVTMLK